MHGSAARTRLDESAAVFYALFRTPSSSGNQTALTFDQRNFVKAYATAPETKPNFLSALSDFFCIPRVNTYNNDASTTNYGITNGQSTALLDELFRIDIFELVKDIEVKGRKGAVVDNNKVRAVFKHFFDNTSLMPKVSIGNATAAVLTIPELIANVTPNYTTGVEALVTKAFSPAMECAYAGSLGEMIDLTGTSSRVLIAARYVTGADRDMTESESTILVGQGLSLDKQKQLAYSIPTITGHTVGNNVTYLYISTTDTWAQPQI